MIELYLDNRLYKLFCDINATNDAIIAQIERGIENVKMYYPEELSPTRKNVLDKRHVFAVSGGTNYFPLEPSNHTIEDLDKLLQPFDDHEEKYQVSMQIIKNFGTYSNRTRIPYRRLFILHQYLYCEESGSTGDSHCPP